MKRELENWQVEGGKLEDSKNRIRFFLLRFARNQQISDEDDIFASGFVHSLVALQLMNFLEQEFQIAILDEDLEADNFSSIRNIADFVKRKSCSRVPLQSAASPAT
jgi:methoxymalonate biosynthesis acyl carrier protein